MKSMIEGLSENKVGSDSDTTTNGLWRYDAEKWFSSQKNKSNIMQFFFLSA